jgi:predicted phage gp36 major capsid-like protein
VLAKTVANLQHQLTELKSDNERIREQMRKEYVEMEAALKAKLLENQRLATEQNEKM